MKNMRMPVGWTLVGTNDLGFGNTETKMEKIKREQKFDKAIHNIVERSIEKMQEDAEKTFLARTNEEAQLLQAYEEKKLKSKELIKKVELLKKHNKKDEDAVATT